MALITMQKESSKNSTLRSNEQLQLAEKFVRFTDRHVFLTGKAGTGKTTFLHQLKTTLNKRLIVVAPTGVAAINAGGMTIHSFFQLPFAPNIPVSDLPQDSGAADHNKFRIQRFSKEKRNIMRSLDLLVIDEISMVRADMLDAIDEVLRRYKNRKLAFGGVQLLMIGDIQQLAPVVKDQDWNILKQYYQTPFFFGSRALSITGFSTIELTEVFRQKDDHFIALLNQVRDNHNSPELFAELNKRYIPDFVYQEDEGYINLCTHNQQARTINDSKMMTLKTPSHFFDATIEGNFPEHIQPLPTRLELKKDAQVMFVKNDPSPDKLFYNGKIGRIIDIRKNEIEVVCPGDDDSLKVEMLTWNNYKYSLDSESKDIMEELIGSFTQYPLKPAWAITIHKSQGLSFDKAIIDAQKAFAHGQVYVALSRCRSLEGLILSSPISGNSFVANQQITQFTEQNSENMPSLQDLEIASKAYQQKQLIELFDFHPLFYQLLYLIKLVRKHQASIQGDAVSYFSECADELKTSTVFVSEKFEKLITSSLSVENTAKIPSALQDRIKKATIYFTPEIEKLSDKVESFSFESDSKAARKELVNALENIKRELHHKLVCIKASKDGFNLEVYLKTKALSRIEGVVKKPKVSKAFNISLEDIDHPELYEEIRQWRHLKHQETDLEHYRILQQKSLLHLAKILPQNKNMLLMVHGIGKRKAEQYGDELLAIIRDYCNKHDLEIDIIQTRKARKGPKKDTKLVSFELYQMGKSINEIAEERGFNKRTIENHLMHFVGTGALELDSLVSPSKARIIRNKLLEMGTDMLSPVKESLGHQFSYSEIGYVRKRMEFEKNRKPGDAF